MKKLFTGILFVALILALGVPIAKALPTTEYTADVNTVALYHFNTASQATDATGNHNGALMGGATVTPGGKFGAGGLSLNGQGQYVNIGQSPAWNMSAGTVEMWVNLSSPLSNNPSGSWVMSNTGSGYGNSWDDGWYLGVHTGYSQNLAFMVWTSGWTSADSGIDPSTLVGGWHHIAGTWGQEGLEIWVDGILKGTNGYTGGVTGAANGIIGSDSWTWDTHGTINEARISDIQRNFTANSVPEPGIILLLSLGLSGIAALRGKVDKR